jgi:hypothetical protein
VTSACCHESNVDIIVPDINLSHHWSYRNDMRRASAQKG